MNVRTPTRQAWTGAKQRCSNPNNRQWKDYGGRGIEVRFASYKEFLAEVGERPPGLTIDRIDNDGHYEPGNIRWATRAEQQYNRRKAVFVEIEGKRYRAIDLAKQAGLKTDTIIARAKKGWPLAKVLSPEYFRDLSGLALGVPAAQAKRQQRMQCLYGHKLTLENTYFSPEGWRRCQECHRLKMRKRYAQGK